MKAKPESWIKLNWFWMILGVLLWALAIFDPFTDLEPIALGLGVGVVVAIGASLKKNNPLRDAAASFCFGVFLGFFVVVSWLISSGNMPAV